MTATDVALIAAVALVLRIGVFLLAAKFSGISLVDQAYINDGAGFIRYGQLILGQVDSLSEYERRIFPGTPFFIAGLLKIGIAPHWAGLLPNWIGAAAGCAGAAVLFRSHAVGWALVFLPPDYLLVSSVVASEGLMLGLIVWGLVLARRRHWLIAGIFLGMAGVVRPMACFAVIGLIASEVSRRRWRGALATALVSAAVVAASLVWLHYRFHDALESARAYSDAPAGFQGEILTWPFRSLIYHTLHYPIGLPKIAFVWVHVAFAIGTVVLLLVRVRREPNNDLPRLGLAWVIGSTVFCICVGGLWGFLCFPRYLAHGLPAMFYGAERWLPRRWYVWLIVAIASVAMCMAMVARRQLQ